MAAGRGNDKDKVCINAITVRSKDVWSVVVHEYVEPPY